MKSTLNTKGFEEYLETLQQAGKDIDPIVDRTLQIGGSIIKDAMVQYAPEETGHLKSRIEMQEANDGNYHAVKIGIFNIDRERELYFFYQEYGSGHGPANPFLRPAFDNKGRKATAAMKQNLINEGAI